MEQMSVEQLSSLPKSRCRLNLNKDVRRERQERECVCVCVGERERERENVRERKKNCFDNISSLFSELCQKILSLFRLK